MSLFDAAERLVESDRINVHFISERCLHSASKLSSCEACFAICPVDAIRAGKPPTFEKASCVNCMACLPACPVGAFDALDAVPSLLRSSARITGPKVELLCQRNSQPEVGPANSSIAVRIRGCLAGLGSSTYLALVVLGKTEMVLRLEECKSCPLGSLKDQILHQASTACNLFPSQDKPIIEIFEDSDEKSLLSPRTVWNADNPPLSRRDLLRLTVQGEEIGLAKSLAGHDHMEDHPYGRERSRINASLTQLLEQDIVHQDSSLEGFNYVQLSISSSCSACGVCARACPTKALIFNQQGDHFRVDFSSFKCIDCAICQKVCTEDAIKIKQNPTIGESLGQDKVQMVIEGDLIRCTRCGVWFSPKQDETFCPICNYRAQHPFGSRLPPGFEPKSRS